MFRHKIQWQDWSPETACRSKCGRVRHFTKRAANSAHVEIMRRSGLGALFEAFEKLKAKLQAKVCLIRQKSRSRASRAQSASSPHSGPRRCATLTTQTPHGGGAGHHLPGGGAGRGRATAACRGAGAAQAHAECDVLSAAAQY
jgi:exodeoxyribonuclease VII large subunit